MEKKKVKAASLLEQAKAIKVKDKHEPSCEELEVVVAYLRGEILNKQACIVLKSSSANLAAAVGRLIIWGVRNNHIKIVVTK